MDKFARTTIGDPGDSGEAPLSFRQKLSIVSLTVLCVVTAVIVFAPAAWVNNYLQTATNGRFALIDPEGDVWNGSARIGVAVDENSELTPVIPGRFDWHLSPIILLGQIELELDNAKSMQAPLYITGNSQHIQISPNSVILPAERLAALGAPLNTIKPSGQMALSWDALGVTLDDGAVDIHGAIKLSMQDIGSALSTVKPLGSYQLGMNWQGRKADIELKTMQGPLLLNGTGKLINGHLRFSGTARASDEQEENLANLLNLLGQRQPGADKNVIALEIK